MALTGTFDADFTAFLGEIDKAKDQLATLRATTDQLSESVSQVVDDEAPAEMNQLAESTERGSAAAAQATISWQEWAKGLVTAEVIIRSVEAAWDLLTGTISDGIGQAIEAEDAQAALLGALQQQGTAVPSVVTAFDDYAAALQRTTIYSADAVTAAEKILVQIGDVMPRDMQAALRATAQLATALEIDLPRAATMVAKAAQGQTSALKQTKIEFGETTGTAVDFTNILKKLEDQYGNNAEQMAKTAGGQMKQAKNAWNDLKQAVGETITRNETVRTLLGDLNRLFVTNTGELTKNKDVNLLVSDAVILVSDAMIGAVEALDLLQQGFFWTEGRLLNLSKSFYEFGIGIQQIEAFTQKYLALDRTLASTRVAEAEAAIRSYRGAIATIETQLTSAETRSTAWSESLQTFKARLQETRDHLDATRGKVVEVNATQAEAPGVWNLATGAMSAQTMAATEHAMAMDLLSGKYVKIGTDVTAAAKARETAAMAEVAAAAKADAEFWKMHDAEEAWQLSMTGAAEQTTDAVMRVTDAVTVSANTMIGAIGQLQALMPGEISEAYAPGAVRSNVNPLLAYELSQRYGGPRQAFGGGGLGSAFGATGGTTNVTVNAMYPIMDDPRAMDSLARTVGDALMSRLSRSGAQF